MSDGAQNFSSLIGLEVDDDETVRWQDAEDARTVSVLSAWPGRAALDRLLAGLPAGRWVWAPVHAGSRWFRTALTTSGVGLGASGDGEVRVLFDPGIEVPERTLREFWPSPDGRWCAVGVLHGSSEAGDLRVVDVSTGAELGPRALFSTMTRAAWTPDGSALFFSGVQFDDTATRGAIYEWPVGGEPRCHLVDCGLDAYPVPSTDGSRVLVTAGSHRLRPVAILDRPADRWERVDVDAGVHLDGVVVGDDLVAITTVAAPRGRVIAAPLNAIADTTRWRELIPESAAVLRAIAILDGSIVVSELVDGCGQLEILDLVSLERTVVPVPIRGALAVSGSAAPLIGASMCRSSGGHREVTFLASGPGSPPRAYRYDLDDRSLRSEGEPSPLPAVTSETIIATSADGTEVACVISYRSDLDRSRPRPTLVVAYGGFNIPNTPRYHPAAAAFIISGGLVAYPLLRGGGEYGDGWWEAGRKHNKQNTFDDLYAVAEQLIAQDVTDRSLLALQGGSNGGLTAAVAAAQRPDLFTAVVATAPLTDLLRHHLAARSPVSSAVTIAEFGDPDDPRDAEVIRSWSPIQNIGPASPAPAVLVAAAEHDVRTPPWHARKLVARLRAERPDAPVFLRIWRNYGHGTGGTTEAGRTSEWLGFIMNELGMTPDDRS